MDKKFLVRTAKVLVVEPLPALRSTIVDIIRSLGFKNTFGQDNLKTALGYMEVEEVDWLITPLLANDTVNAFHVLNTIDKNSNLQHLRVSLFIEPTENIYLSKAFELGLFTFHERSNKKEVITSSLKNLLHTFESHYWNQILTSAEYLAKHLKTIKDTSDLVMLFERLVEHNSENEFLMLSLADARHLNGQSNDAVATLGQMRALGMAGWEKKATEWLGDSALCQPNLGIQRCILIDPDEAVHIAVRQCFSKFPDLDLQCFSDGMTAFEWCLANQPPDLILMEWRIPLLSGPALLQRFRQCHIVAPIVIVSSLTTKSDIVLLNEMGVSGVIQKPLEEDRFIKSILQVIQLEKYPSSVSSLERKIHHLLLKGETEKARFFQIRLDAMPHTSPASVQFVNGLFAFYADNFENAKMLAMEAIRTKADEIRFIYLLGKCLVKIRDFQGAVKCFRKAQDLSPKNVERLCELAGVHYEIGEIHNADVAISAAKLLDSHSPAVEQQMVKRAIQEGKLSEAKELFKSTKILPTIVADLNNSAVAHIRCGEFEQGISLYQKTIEAMPEGKHELRSRVMYNLGLAHARQGSLPAALNALNGAATIQAPETTQMKLKSLRSRVQKAIDSNTSVALSPMQTDNSKESLDLEGFLKDINDSADQKFKKKNSVSLGKPRFCRTFFQANSQSNQELVIKLMQNPPPFKVRPAIQREESFGIERLFLAEKI